MTTLVRHDLTDPAIPEGMVRIVQGGSYRFIWPVHLGGWQSLGWQLQPAAGLIAPEPRLPEPELAPSAQPPSEVVEDLAPVAPVGADLQSAPLGATFQAMTKAQIIEHCSSVYGVELDGSQTKAELVEQATSLELQAVTAIDGLLPDALVDDPLI